MAIPNKQDQALLDEAVDGLIGPLDSRYDLMYRLTKRLRELAPPEPAPPLEPGWYWVRWSTIGRESQGLTPPIVMQWCDYRWRLSGTGSDVRSDDIAVLGPVAPWVEPTPIDGPRDGLCPLCGERVPGARLNGLWCPQRGPKHKGTCPNFTDSVWGGGYEAVAATVYKEEWKKVTAGAVEGLTAARAALTDRDILTQEGHRAHALVAIDLALSTVTTKLDPPSR
jgi:hypothetical protein